MAEFAPAHNDAALALINEVSSVFGQWLAQVAVFDTAFRRVEVEARSVAARPSTDRIARFG